MTKYPNNWQMVAIEEILAPLENGNILQQGWSPLCERFPSEDNEKWGVVKTTAIQRGEFLPEHNKQLPEQLSPRENIEIKEGDILMTCAGPRLRCGVTCLVKKTRAKLMMSGKMYRFRIFDKYFSSKYLEAFLHTQEASHAIDKMKTGISDSGLNLTHSRFKQLQVPVAPIKEQHRIVEKIEELFSELDKGIESLKTTREQLKVYRQALLKHAFDGKLTEQWRKDNLDKLETADELLIRIKQEREMCYQIQITEWEKDIGSWEKTGKEGKKPGKPKPIKELPALSHKEITELPSLPDGWFWGRLGSIFSNSPKNGIYKPLSEYGEGAYIIRIDDFYDGQLVRKNGFKRLKLTKDEYEIYELKEFDLLINRVNSIEYLGKCCEIKSITEPVVFESNIMRLVILSNVMNGVLLTLYLASFSGRNRLCSNAKHAVNQASINQTDVAMTPIPICGIDEQEAMSKMLEAQTSLVDVQLNDIDANLLKSKALRQSILKKAFSGKLIRQDPNDEPASELLKRITQEKLEIDERLKAATIKAKKKTTTTKKKVTKKVKTV